MFIAARYNRLRNVALLLSKNADPTVNADAIDEVPQESAVHVSARFGNMEVLLKFLDYGCDLTACNGEGLDCEMIAWKYGHSDLARLIWQRVQKSSRSLTAL